MTGYAATPRTPLVKELATTKAALEIAGKAHALLEILSESADSEPKPKK
jgi:hypothetical protein